MTFTAGVKFTLCTWKSGGIGSGVCLLSKTVLELLKIGACRLTNQVCNHLLDSLVVPIPFIVFRQDVTRQLLTGRDIAMDMSLIGVDGGCLTVSLSDCLIWNG